MKTRIHVHQFHDCPPELTLLPQDASDRGFLKRLLEEYEPSVAGFGRKPGSGEVTHLSLKLIPSRGAKP